MNELHLFSMSSCLTYALQPCLLLQHLPVAQVLLPLFEVLLQHLLLVLPPVPLDPSLDRVELVQDFLLVVHLLVDLRGHRADRRWRLLRVPPHQHRLLVDLPYRRLPLIHHPHRVRFEDALVRNPPSLQPVRLPDDRVLHQHLVLVPGARIGVVLTEQQTQRLLEDVGVASLRVGLAEVAIREGLDGLGQHVRPGVRSRLDKKVGVHQFNQFMKGYKAVHAQPIKQGKAHSKTKKTQRKKSLLHYNVNKIKNKIRRNEILQKRQLEVKKLKKVQRKDEDRQKFQPLTTEDKREIDDNFVLDDDDQELDDEEHQDEFEEYFRSDKPARILLTTSYRPSRQMFDFLKDIKDVFGVDCHYWPRRKFTIDQITEFATSKDYTDMLMFREDKHKVNQLIMTHLPHGPTAVFQVSNIKLSFDIHHHARITDHFPELILNHFNTKVGRRIARFFATLFPQNPEFKGRRVVTFHNQRDFIFFRHHRYMFQEEGEKAALQEIGPQFTLRLQSLKKGNYSSDDIEFEKHDSMYVSRKRVYV